MYHPSVLTLLKMTYDSIIAMLPAILISSLSVEKLVILFKIFHLGQRF